MALAFVCCFAAGRSMQTDRNVLSDSDLDLQSNSPAELGFSLPEHTSTTRAERFESALSVDLCAELKKF